MKDLILNELSRDYTVRRRNVEPYAVLKKAGMTFNISACEIEGLGSMSVIDMSAMAGLMSMESFILTAEEKDAPLFSGDYIEEGGTCTLLYEFYDNMLSPLDEESAYFAAYRENLRRADTVDPAAKRAKTADYVDGLFSNGGPAVDQFKTLFGEETAREIFEKYVFSCKA